MTSPRAYKYPNRSVQFELLTSDAIKTVYASPAPFKEQVVLTAIHVVSLVPAAQIMIVRDQVLGVIALKLPPSLPAGWTIHLHFDPGIEMARGQNLIVMPAAPGPGQFWVVEFYITGSGSV